ncbi:DUF2207 domain-containing protein [Anaerococcus kampingiae]|uniref:DUF2207 domain-containing protein n=1 Tax=Anaerococcus kampingae TaxID=3115614 RepID=A0ABW9MBA3_9FIRM
MKKLLTIIAMSLMIFLPKEALADEFKEINIEAKLDEKGIGSIKETWHIDENDTDYTERYKAINNLRGLKIEDFSVSAFGKDFEKADPWDIDKSFEEKAYRYGTVQKDDGYELCWGISKYEDNVYDLKYKISPLAIGLNDADMVFFKFVGDDFDPMPEKVNIKITSYKPIERDVKFWGFGLKGNIENRDGVIELNSTGGIDYATVMIKFPKGTFATSYREDKNFKDYADQAVKGSKREENQGKAYKPPMPVWAKILIGLASALGLAGAFAGIRAAKLSFSEKRITNLKDLRKPKDFGREYLKDIPYDGHIEDLAFIIEKTYINSISLAEDYVNAFILKWALAKKIDLGEDKYGLVSEKKIKILERPDNMGALEGKYFDTLYKASLRSHDGFLTDYAYQKYLEKNKDSLDNFYEDLEDLSLATLKEKGYIEDYEYEKTFLSSSRTGTELRLTQKGISLYEDLCKFKSYLASYELVGEKSQEEMPKWKGFLVYAQILGLGESFEKIVERDDYYMNNFIYYPYLFTNSRGFSKSINQSYGEATGFSNAGFGGATSVGGGGGSFGGGGGGGR